MYLAASKSALRENVLQTGCGVAIDPAAEIMIPSASFAQVKKDLAPHLKVPAQRREGAAQNGTPTTTAAKGIPEKTPPKRDEYETGAGAAAKASANNVLGCVDMPGDNDMKSVNSQFQQAEAAHALLAAELEAVLNEAKGVGKCSEQESAAAAASASERAQRDAELKTAAKKSGSAGKIATQSSTGKQSQEEDIKFDEMNGEGSSSKATSSRKKSKKVVMESAEKLEKMLADLQYVQALELNAASSVKVLTEWYS